MEKIVRTADWRICRPENREEYAELILETARKCKVLGSAHGLLKILEGKAEYLAENLMANGYDEEAAYHDSWDDTWCGLLEIMDAATYANPAEIVTRLLVDNDTVLFQENTINRSHILSEGHYSMYRIVGPRLL